MPNARPTDLRRAALDVAIPDLRSAIREQRRNRRRGSAIGGFKVPDRTADMRKAMRDVTMQAYEAARQENLGFFELGQRRARARLWLSAMWRRFTYTVIPNRLAKWTVGMRIEPYRPIPSEDPKQLEREASVNNALQQLMKEVPGMEVLASKVTPNAFERTRDLHQSTLNRYGQLPQPTSYRAPVPPRQERTPSDQLGSSDRQPPYYPPAASSARHAANDMAGGYYLGRGEDRHSGPLDLDRFRGYGQTSAENPTETYDASVYIDRNGELQLLERDGEATKYHEPESPAEVQRRIGELFKAKEEFEGRSSGSHLPSSLVLVSSDGIIDTPGKRPTDGHSEYGNWVAPGQVNLGFAAEGGKVFSANSIGDIPPGSTAIDLDRANLAYQAQNGQFYSKAESVGVAVGDPHSLTLVHLGRDSDNRHYATADGRIFTAGELGRSHPEARGALTEVNLSEENARYRTPDGRLLGRNEASRLPEERRENLALVDVTKADLGYRDPAGVVHSPEDWARYLPKDRVGDAVDLRVVATGYLFPDGRILSRPDAAKNDSGEIPQVVDVGQLDRQSHIGFVASNGIVYRPDEVTNMNIKSLTMIDQRIYKPDLSKFSNVAGMTSAGGRPSQNSWPLPTDSPPTPYKPNPQKVSARSAALK